MGLILLLVYSGEGMEIKDKLLSIFAFTKIEHTIFSLPIVLTGAWLGVGREFPSFVDVALIVFATIGARIFGISFNRIFDRKIDALNPRTSGRELPIGKIKVEGALWIALVGLVIYIISCAALSKICLKLSPIPLVFLLLYSFLKRVTFLCHFGIGFCLALAPLSAFVATSGHIQFGLPVLMFSCFVFFWMSGADILYAILDIDSDRVNGIYSLPAKFGMKTSELVAGYSHVIAVFLLGFTIFILDGDIVSWGCFFITGIFFFVIHLPFIPLSIRFFPISSFASIAGSFTLILT